MDFTNEMTIGGTRCMLHAVEELRKADSQGP